MHVGHAGGCRVPAFIASPLLPPTRRGGRTETAFVHIADWYATFAYLAGVTQNPRDEGPGRFAVDGRNLWPYLSGSPTSAAQPPKFHNVSNMLVLGYNYSTLNFRYGFCPVLFSVHSRALAST
eukprot:m.517713 g.517713  ORF g.517713 m.517713 type:complete len:123 (-) comp21935_c0_seq56:2395-2763(-)